MKIYNNQATELFFFLRTVNRTIINVKNNINI